MKNIKKFLSLLAITVFAYGTLGLSLTTTANASVWDDLKDLITTENEGDLSFDQYEPTESLTLSKEGYNESLTESEDLKEFVILVVNFALGFLGLLAVIIVIYGGVLYVTAGGEEEKTTTGRKAITYAAIGLLIVLGSFAFVNTVIKGASGEGETGKNKYVVGENIGGSFNAAATQVRSIAKEIYSGFIFFAETFEEVKSVINDANKSSLDYTKTLPPKNDIINFLYSVKDKLQNIRGKVMKFSTAYVKINELIRNIESDIDTVQNLNEAITVLYNENNEIVTAGEITVCDPNNPPPIDEELEEFVETFDATTISCNGEPYFKGLFEKWKQIKTDMLTNDESSQKSLAYILPPLKEDYKTNLIRNFEKLTEIRQSLTGIEAVDAGGIGKIFNDMITGYGYKPETPLGPYDSGTFLKTITDWSISSKAEDIDKTGGILFKALENQLKFSDELLKLKSVEAHLQANVVSGNAPLLVTFDVLNSVDPAGGSIVDKNIDWTNLAGTATYEGQTVDIGTAVYCSTPVTEEDKEAYGPAFRQCTFKQPGTYIATVKIKSNDPTKYVAGMSSLIIKVNPPTTKIELTLEVGSAKKKIPVMSYYDNGILKLDKDYIPVTLSEAKDNITFDASKTGNVSNFKWDFGDGKISEGMGDTYGKQDHSYKEEGKYLVKLEVMNKLGELDRKIFTLDVRNVAARIQVKPNENIFIEKPIIIDGTLSSSSSGKIKGYEWKIEKTSKGSKTGLDLGVNANKASFTYQFQEPGKYEINLKVTSDLETVEADPYIISVESKKPVALFEYKTKDSAKPNTYSFSASKSFDPDGSTKNFEYKWTISPDTETGTNWELADKSTLTQKDPVIKFKKKGEYEVTLKVTDTSTKGTDIPEEYGELTKTIKVENILDISWSSDQEVTGLLKDGKAAMNFEIESDNAIAYEIDFGDGNKNSGEIKKTKTIPYTYQEAGKYTVKVKVYDTEDNDTSIERRIFISGGDKPIAQIGIFVNGAEITDLSKPIKINKKDIVTFDGSGSKNVDGTGRNLKYSWDFGDMEKSSNKSATHSYKNLSPQKTGFYEAILLVTDKENPDKKDEDKVQFDVVNASPTFSSLQGIPDTLSSDLITPVTVDMRVYGADDPDGEITQYKWWYFDLDDPDEPLGIQITRVPTAKISIGTNGKEGREITYGFGLEVTDSDNLSVSSKDILNETQSATIKVTNGPNEMPEAKFKVDTTSIFTGDKIMFTSTSTDKDGQIKQHIWDFEGDGFFNNAPTDKVTVEHIYTEKNLKGYDVRLKVIDDKGGESVSKETKIYVDTLAKAPTAAFKFAVIEGSGGKKVKFYNNSTADEKAGANIINYKWDFDTDSDKQSADSDGDGKKDNDNDSQAENPERLYTDFGTYKVKLTVTDNQGNTDDVIQTLTIPMANPPIAAFTYEVIEDSIVFKNNSTADKKNGAKIIEYVWDFDTESQLITADSDGDGKKDNDKDSTVFEPVHKYKEEGLYKVRLIVKDNQGNMDDVTNIISTDKDVLPTDAVLSTSKPSETGDFDKTKNKTDINPILMTNPSAEADGLIHIKGKTGTISFDFSKSTGAISNYILDKNIYYDTDGNGIKNDDNDFKTNLPGTWTTNFDSSWGKTEVKLTVLDMYGNESSITQEIIFE